MGRNTPPLISDRRRNDEEQTLSFHGVRSECAVRWDQHWSEERPNRLLRTAPVAESSKLAAKMSMDYHRALLQNSGDICMRSTH